AAGTRGLHPGIRAGGPATPTSNAARAGAATIIALTIKLDPSVGADHLNALGLMTFLESNVIMPHLRRAVYKSRKMHLAK
ncbi:hypothetical protein, partial [Mesorhizobium sp. J18]|uniref:hypothetical protein n=1 Tax=Mesorhizobium sp. J18 TaxID=935263 RepID=UPI001AEE7B9F